MGSGSIADRPELARCVDYLRDGDTLVVWRLDRLGPIIDQLSTAIADLEARSVAFCSLPLNVDTTTAAERLQLHLFAALRSLSASWAASAPGLGFGLGLRPARARGRVRGRRTVITARKLLAELAMREKSEMTMSDIAAELGVGEATLHRRLARHHRENPRIVSETSGSWVRPRFGSERQSDRDCRNGDSGGAVRRARRARSLAWSGRVHGGSRPARTECAEEG